MRIKLNRWQRLGIILSVIAFTGLGLFAWGSEEHRRFRLYESMLGMCHDILNTKNENSQYITIQADREKKVGANQLEFLNCKSEAADLLHGSIENAYESLPIWLAINLGIIVFGWLIGWFIVAITKWIAQDFA